MKGAVQTLGCPTCGGALVIAPGQRIVRCRYCSGKKLVRLADDWPRYAARPVISARDAHTRMRNALESPHLAAGLARRVRLTRPRLFLVPFYELHARRAGRARLDKLGFKTESRVNWSGDGAVSSRARMVRTSEVDTRVIIASWSFSWPAVELPAWGIEGIDPQRARRHEGVSIERYDAVEIDRTGTALEPTIGAETFRKAALRAEPVRQADIRTIETRLQLLYYPVWRASYVAGGHLHRATVDGIDGRVLRVRGPSGDTRRARRVIGLAAAAGASAALVGRIAHDLATTTGATAVAPILIGGIALGAAIAASVGAARRAATSRDVVLVARADGLGPR